MTSYEAKIRNSLSIDEVASRIEKLGGTYNPLSGTFDAYDQLLACEAISETYSTSTLTKEHKSNEENDDVYGNDNGGCRQQVKFELTTTKLEAISKLKTLTYRTPPPKISALLETIFQGYDTTQGWWLTAAQWWNPRAINRTLDEFVRLHLNGWITLNNPPAYFTSLLKHRKKRRGLLKPKVAVDSSWPNI